MHKKSKKLIQNKRNNTEGKGTQTKITSSSTQWHNLPHSVSQSWIFHKRRNRAFRSRFAATGAEKRHSVASVRCEDWALSSLKGESPREGESTWATFEANLTLLRQHFGSQNRSKIDEKSDQTIDAIFIPKIVQKWRRNPFKNRWTFDEKSIETSIKQWKTIWY